MMLFVLGFPVAGYLAVEYVLVGILWRRLEGDALGWNLVAAWAGLGLAACLLAEWGERMLRRRGRMEGAFLVLAPGPLAGVSVAVLSQRNLHEPGLGLSVAWPHALALLIVLQRANRAGERFGDAPLLRRLLRGLLIFGAGGFFTQVLFLWRYPAPGFSATVNMVLSSWLGLGLAWAVMQEVVDRTPALALLSRVRSALGTGPLSMRPQVMQLRRALALSVTAHIPLDFPESLVEATFDDPVLARASFDLLTEIRRVTVRGVAPNRELVWACISAQRRLGELAIESLLTNLDAESALERLLIVKAFLLMPPAAESKSEMAGWLVRVDERLAAELWLNFSYQSFVAEHVASAVTTVRHDIIKHQYANLPGQPRGSALSRERIAAVVPPQLSAETSSQVGRIVRQLALALRQIGEVLMTEEIAEAESLALAPVVGREQMLRLDGLIERTRTMADEIRRLLRVNLGDWLAGAIRYRQGVHTAVGFRLDYDSTLRESLKVVAPTDWLEQLFGNLLDNAARAALDAQAVRPPAVEVAVRLVGDPRSPTIEVTVGDSGAGMPVAARRTVWEGGTGLQLVLEALRRLQGEIRVEDSPLGGAQMVVTIPRNVG